VAIRLDASLEALERQGDEIVLRMTGGERLVADLVVVGVGVQPNDELARDAGLPVDRGVVVDEFGRTADPLVFAAGDVARHYNPLLKRHILLESWQNAQNQAIAVARTIAGGVAPYAEVPWFWSDQFGVNLQVVGLIEPGCRTLLRGTPGQGPALVLQVRDGRLVSAAALDAPRELRFAKELILSGAVLDEAALASPDIRLADLLRDVKQRKAAA
ncbi:MAG: oxidoreductase C-terminal domain-containing protein, partial [Caulobacteraceae bacterium]